MKIIITADLHYNVPRSIGPTRRLAQQNNRSGADVVVLLGDTAGHEIDILSECLHLFDSFTGTKLLVMGNHELWSDGDDSLDRYERRIPAAAREAGFHSLDREPFVVDRVGFVGSVGWYDYSFRDRGLEVPMRFYEAKVGPGTAQRLSEYRYLLDDTDDIPERAWQITARWMDGVYVRLPYSDPEFTNLLADKLERQLRSLPDEIHSVVACIHHVPFVELVRRRGRASWDFAGAFLGSECFGRILLQHPKVSHVYCGHSHQQARIRRAGLECINVGCTYRAKRFEVLDI